MDAPPPDFGDRFLVAESAFAVVDTSIEEIAVQGDGPGDLHSNSTDVQMNTDEEEQEPVRWSISTSLLRGLWGI
ncbi:hypothetical protein L916_17177 [Phytophthora nicotianae]|uniref:Uncharacterized protein n=1 Tax=Phytophthora nicotianae TaxID=4792 RepID=W2I6J9_PHYNI|nr:hypothetical protein L916_17177 [Phytophthora nicotianae]